MANYCPFSLLPIRGKKKDKIKLERYFKSLLLDFDYCDITYDEPNN